SYRPDEERLHIAVVGIDSEEINPVLYYRSDIFMQQSQSADRCRNKQDALREFEYGDQYHPSVAGAFSWHTKLCRNRCCVQSCSTQQCFGFVVSSSLLRTVQSFLAVISFAIVTRYAAGIAPYLLPRASVSDQMVFQ